MSEGNSHKVGVLGKLKHPHDISQRFWGESMVSPRTLETPAELFRAWEAVQIPAQGQPRPHQVKLLPLPLRLWKVLRNRQLNS